MVGGGKPWVSPHLRCTVYETFKKAPLHKKAPPRLGYIWSKGGLSYGAEGPKKPKINRAPLYKKNVDKKARPVWGTSGAKGGLS